MSLLDLFLLPFHVSVFIFSYTWSLFLWGGLILVIQYLFKTYYPRRPK